MPITVRKLHPLFAAEVTGVDLTRPIDDPTFGQIRAAFEEHSVLVFRDQHFTDETQIAFSERFGLLETTIRSNQSAGSKVVRVSNVGLDGEIMPVETDYMRYLTANELWHSDSSFKPIPALASLLSGRETPPEGGNTEFAGMRAAWDALPDATRARLETAIAEHSFEFSRGKVGENLLTEEQRRALPPVRQTMVRVNPVNLRKALYVGSHASHIVGDAVEPSRRFIEELVEFATQPQFVYSHPWRQWDAVMWDNRATLHRGTGFDKGRYRRVMIRTTIEGEGPTVALSSEVKVAA